MFGGDLKFEVGLKAGADFAPKPGDAITVTIDYQGCNNNECLRPASVSTTVALAAPAAAAGVIEGIGAGSRRHLAAESAAAMIPAAPSSTSSQSRMVPRLPRGISRRPRAEPDAVRYPLIGVTIAYFGNQGGGHRRVMYLASSSCSESR